MALSLYVNAAAINSSHRLGSNLHIHPYPPPQEPATTSLDHSGNRFWPNRPSLHKIPTPVSRRSPDTISPSPTVNIMDARPTPDPTGSPSTSTTVHINSGNDFSLILPENPGELIGDAESDGVAFCSPSSDPSGCDGKKFPEGFVTAAAYTASEDGAYIQVRFVLLTFIHPLP
ncbi:hypothetical protein H0H93_010253 [Arthromyces matolae]|nr:hypothetical protein H0H93_010253 [Arthromyces matolae]